MTLRTDLLPVFDDARSLIDDLGLRATRVILRTKAWDSDPETDEARLGDPTTTDLELSPRPKVRDLGNGSVMVGPITPLYTAGGYAMSTLLPSLTSGQEHFWVLIGEDGGEQHYLAREFDTRRAFRIMVRLECADLADPLP